MLPNDILKLAYDAGFRLALSDAGVKVAAGFSGGAPGWDARGVGIAAGMVGQGAPSMRAGGGTGAIRGAINYSRGLDARGVGITAGMVGQGAPSMRAGGGTGNIAGTIRAARSANPSSVMSPADRSTTMGMVGQGAPSMRAGGGTGALGGAISNANRMASAPGASAVASAPSSRPPSS